MKLNTLSLTLLATIIAAAVTAAEPACTCEPIHPKPVKAPPCPKPLNYWRTHLKHEKCFPADSLKIGRETYSRAQMLALLSAPEPSDPMLCLVRQVICVKANQARGCETTIIKANIDCANRLLSRARRLASGTLLPRRIGPLMVREAAVLERFNECEMTPACKGKK